MSCISLPSIFCPGLSFLASRVELRATGSAVPAGIPEVTSIASALNKPVPSLSSSIRMTERNSHHVTQSSQAWPVRVYEYPVSGTLVYGGAPVIFQDVVHSERTGEADCAEQSSFPGVPEWTFTRMPDLAFVVERP